MTRLNKRISRAGPLHIHKVVSVSTVVTASTQQDDILRPMTGRNANAQQMDAALTQVIHDYSG